MRNGSTNVFAVTDNRTNKKGPASSMSTYGSGFYGLDFYSITHVAPPAPATPPTRVTNSVLNLVSPPISDMALLHGILDGVTIGENVPSSLYATQIVDIELASPLVGAPNGRLSEVRLGAGL